jgi:hypothetical protein
LLLGLIRAGGGYEVISTKGYLEIVQKNEEIIKLSLFGRVPEEFRKGLGSVISYDGTTGQAKTSLGWRAIWINLSSIIRSCALRYAAPLCFAATQDAKSEENHLE